MEWFKERFVVIFCAFINILMASRIMQQTLRIRNFNYLFIAFLYLISVGIYWVEGYVLKSRKYRIITNFMMILSMSFIYYKNYNNINKFVQKQFIDNFNILYKLTDKLKPTEFYQYKYLLILGFIILIPIVLTIAFRFNSIMLVSNFSYILIMWFLGYTKEIIQSLGLYLFVTLFSCAMLTYGKRIKEFRKKSIEIRIGKLKIVIYACIFSLIISGISGALPQNFSGKYSTEYKGKLVNKFARYGEKSEIDLARQNSYNLKSSGYSDNDKKLGGRIAVNDKVAFQIRGSSVKYLKGSVKDYYTGELWKKSSYVTFWKKEKEGKIINNYKVRNYDVKKGEIYIYPDSVRTTTLFTPSYAYDVKNARGTVYYDGTPVFMTNQAQDTTYSIQFDIGGFETLEEFKKWTLNNKHLYTNYFLGNMKYSKGDVKEFINLNYEDKYEANSFEIMDSDSVKNKYHNYLQVPSSVPERIYRLVYEITDGCKNNVEKVEKIMNYLDKNYKYSTEVFDIPKGREFTDYFLFDDKKGYCTYFATTMNVMCRIAGIPTRYVEGFKLSKKVDGKNFVKVTNEEAHAWCEILMDPYADLWVIADPAPTPIEYGMKHKKKKNNGFELNGIKPNKNLKKIDEKQDFREIQVNNVKSISKVKIAIIVFLLSILFILVINYVITKTKKNKRINNNSIIPLYCYTLKRLEAIGIVKNDSMADMEFALSINDDKLKDKVIDIVEVYYKEYYGNIIDGEFDKGEFYKYIEEYILAKQGKTEYYLKNFLNKI